MFEMSWVRIPAPNIGCIKKTENKRKVAGVGPFFYKKLLIEKEKDRTFST